MLWFIPLGFAIGTLGTLVGAGGGFILVPVLLMLYPDEPADVLTSVSMSVVLANAFSGSIAYARMKRINYKAGLVFTIAALPGAFLGSFATSYVSRRAFDTFVGIALLGIAAFLAFKPPAKRGSGDGHAEGHQITTKALTIGGLLSTVVGFLSSFMGIGGGVVHVPALIYLAQFPVHVATATSHFVLVWTSAVAVLGHVVTGTYSDNYPRTLCLVVGVLAGAQLGARLSKRIKDNTIVRGLAACLALVAVRVLWQALH